jgi:hypothetical protein
VLIQGLTGASHLNGTEGVALSFDDESGRWHVRLPGGETKAIKLKNLQGQPPVGQTAPVRAKSSKIHGSSSARQSAAGSSSDQPPLPSSGAGPCFQRNPLQEGSGSTWLGSLGAGPSSGQSPLADRPETPLGQDQIKVEENSEESEEEASFEECLEEAETQGGASASTGPTVAETNQSPAARGNPTAAQLAAAPPAMQKQLIGAKLFPAVFRIHPHLEAADIAGMLLQMDNAELLQLLEPGPQLEILVGEALLGLVTYPPDLPGAGAEELEAPTAHGHTVEVTTQGQAEPDPEDLEDR